MGQNLLRFATEKLLPIQAIGWRLTGLAWLFAWRAWWDQTNGGAALQDAGAGLARGCRLGALRDPRFPDQWHFSAFHTKACLTAPVSDKYRVSKCRRLSRLGCQTADAATGRARIARATGAPEGRAPRSRCGDRGAGGFGVRRSAADQATQKKEVGAQGSYSGR